MIWYPPINYYLQIILFTEMSEMFFVLQKYFVLFKTQNFTGISSVCNKIKIPPVESLITPEGVIKCITLY